jgi:hypothetical protein
MTNHLLTHNPAVSPYSGPVNRAVAGFTISQTLLRRQDRPSQAPTKTNPGCRGMSPTR